MGRVQRRKSKQSIDQRLGVICVAPRNHQHSSSSPLKCGCRRWFSGLPGSHTSSTWNVYWGLFLKKGKVARGLKGYGWCGVRFRFVPEASFLVQSSRWCGGVEKDLRLTPPPPDTTTLGFGYCNSVHLAWAPHPGLLPSSQTQKGALCLFYVLFLYPTAQPTSWLAVAWTGPLLADRASLRTRCPRR